MNNLNPMRLAKNLRAVCGVCRAPLETASNATSFFDSTYNIIQKPETTQKPYSPPPYVPKVQDPVDHQNSAPTARGSSFGYYHPHDSGVIETPEVNQPKQPNNSRSASESAIKDGQCKCVLCKTIFPKPPNSKSWQNISLCSKCNKGVVDNLGIGTDSGSTPLESADFEYLDFEFLPAGEWRNPSKPLRYLSELISLKSRNNFIGFDINRIRVIERLKPDRRYSGINGLNGYLAYEFLKSKVTLFECPFDGNATYVIVGKWKTLAKLSKRMILDSKNGYRIIHSDNWKQRVQDAAENIIYYP